ncbi:hypothetical protein OIV83_006335 [Microbotryomycetes sp. JL201]|nr:hypothetical protein OIV83_006335 [Microbotryomycetes sp. JL201]
MSNTKDGATNLARAVLRSAKNTIKGNSPAAIAARDASSNDPYGPAHYQLCQVAEMTFNELSLLSTRQVDCADIIAVLDKRLSDSGKMWRHVFKSLAVIEHCLLFGSRLFVRYFLENKNVIKSLKDFRHVDEFNVDQGANIRERARELMALLDNEERLYYERKNGRGSWRDRPRNFKSEVPWKKGQTESASTVSKPATLTSNGGKSQAQLDEERAERELQEALRISREEEEERQRLMKAQQADVDLFDVHETPSTAASTGHISQQEWYAQQQQAQQMAWLQQASLAYYKRPQHCIDVLFLFLFQQQAQYAYQQAMEQQAAYAQQQQLMAMQQAAYLQQQQQEQMNQYYALQQQQQAAYLQQQQQQQQQEAMTMQPQSTGQLPATNPFAAFPSNDGAPATADPPHRLRVAANGDSKHSDLARMLANGSGEDTFGNRAELRVPTC